MKKFYLNSLILLCSAVLLFVSCREEEKLSPTIRSIKTFTVKEQASAQLRKFSGVIYATDYSYLSFEGISGRVLEVNVDIGDKVKKGQVLAVLDRERYELDVKNAEAELVKANASLVKAKSDYDREIELFKKQASFQKRVDTRKFQLDAAKSEVKSAQAKLGLAKRNLRHTELKAPYDGYIGERHIEPKQQVRLGQKIFRIDAEGDLEIQFDIPEDLMKRVKIGMSGTVKFPSLADYQAKSKITFLGTAAGKGNAFPAKASLINPKTEIRPGMTAEISLMLPVNDKKIGYLIPLQAVLPADQPKTGYIYVCEPKTKILRKVKVTAYGQVGNLGIVRGDFKAGDIIATAGVSFLADGMKVKLYKPKDPAFDENGN